jgi:protein ImuA
MNQQPVPVGSLPAGGVGRPLQGDAASDIGVELGARQTVAWLREQLHRFEAARRPACSERMSTGWEPLDRLLPAGGVTRGSLVEWLSAAPGCGAGTLALGMARQACREGRPLVVVERRGEPRRGGWYPPAFCGQGILLEQTILVRAGDRGEELWALEQVLRTEGVGAVLCWAEGFGQRALRRLQLATEVGGGLCLLLRPASVRTEPCWGRLRLLVEPLSMSDGSASAAEMWVNVRRLRVRVMHVHGGAGGQQVDLEIDETGSVRVVSPLAGRAASHKRRRA